MKPESEQWDTWFTWVDQAKAELKPGLWERTILMVDDELTRLLGVEQAAKQRAAKAPQADTYQPTWACTFCGKRIKAGTQCPCRYTESVLV